MLSLTKHEVVGGSMEWGQGCLTLSYLALFVSALEQEPLTPSFGFLVVCS